MLKMRRRGFIAFLGDAAAWPLATRAQQADRVRRIGMLFGLAENDPESPLRLAAFRQTLERLGWKEGVNLRIDYRWGGAGDPDRMRSYAKELIGATPDVVVAESTPATAALQQGTPTTPLIFVHAGNPVGSGFVASFARPGGNLTGFTNYAPAMGGKWLELLKEIAPRLTRAAALFNPKTHTGQYWDVLDAAAESFNVKFTKAPVENAAEIGRAVEVIAGEPSGGLVVMPDSFTLSHRETIVGLTARYSVPAIYAFKVFPVSGGLISYGMSLFAVYRDVASYVDRILRGEKPGDLPVQAPTKFEMVINLNTAKALGLTVSPTLLARADEVIE
jgi:putative tryptophan/tyrosine transport system substrate-binding protein